jgi:CheY-like chemotaxis protein
MSPPKTAKTALATPRGAGSRPGKAPAKLPRVLLIDDDAVSREVLAMTLEMHGFPVDAAEDGAQAIGKLGGSEGNSAAPELILMDTQMPGLSGAGLIRKLRQISPARIVAISGSEAERAVREAADGFLLKPVEVEELKKLLAPPASRKSPVRRAHRKENSISAATAGDVGGVADSGRKTLVDPTVLGKLKAMMSAAALREIYAATATDMESRLGGLAKAMDAGQAAEVSRIAHAIKGGCAMVGLTAAKDAAARLESGNREEMWPKELAELTFALDNLQRILSDGLPW